MARVAGDIDSIKHPLVVLARSLTTAAGRKQYKKCLIYTRELIELAQKAGSEIETIFYDPLHRDPIWIASQESRGINCLSTSSGILKKISDSTYLIPVIAVASIAITKDIKGKFALMLDRVVDHGNIGTIIRTARGFGISDFVTTQETDFFYKKIIEASRGLVFGSNIVENVSPNEALEYVREKGYYLIATSPTGKQLQSMCRLPAKPIMLAVGNETDGVSKEILDAADLVIQIPMPVEVESLNVGVFAGISMYELKLKQVITMLKELIKSSLGRDLGVTMHLMRSVFDIELAKVSPFSSQQMILLMMISCDKVTPRDTAMKEMGIFGDSFEEMIVPLVEEGYLIDEDLALEITKKGEEVVAKLWPVHEKTEQLLLKGLTEEDKNRLQEILKQMQNTAVELLHKEK